MKKCVGIHSCVLQPVHVKQYTYIYKRKPNFLRWALAEGAYAVTSVVPKKNCC